MNESLCPAADITLAVNFAEGLETGVYVLIVTDCLGKEIYRHTIGSPASHDPVCEYINRKFIDNKRFRNLRATISRETGMFVYRGTDEKRRKAIHAEVLASAPPGFIGKISFDCLEIPVEFL